MRLWPIRLPGSSMVLVVFTASSVPGIFASADVYPESSLIRRQVYIGGWAFRSFDSCPADSTICGKARGSLACCPADNECVVGNGYGSHVACCPKKIPDCIDLIRMSPMCADSSMILWTYKKDYYEHWCCRPEETGYVQLVGGGGEGAGTGACAPEGVKVTGSLLGFTVLPATISGGTPSTATVGSGSASSPTATNLNNATIPTDAADNGGSNLSDESVNNSGSSNSNTSSSSGGGKVSLRTIIGAVVGGLVVLGLIAWLVMAYLRRRRRANAMAAVVFNQQGGYYGPQVENKPGFGGPQIQPQDGAQISPHNTQYPPPAGVYPALQHPPPAGAYELPQPPTPQQGVYVPPPYPENAHHLDGVPIQNRPVREGAAELDSGQYYPGVNGGVDGQRPH